MKISFYPGCSLEGMANDYARSIQSVFKELGIDLVEIEDWTGCGATAAVAQVNGDKCTACLACVRVCPFSAPFINEEGVSCIPRRRHAWDAVSVPQNVRQRQFH